MDFFQFNKCNLNLYKMWNHGSIQICKAQQSITENISNISVQFQFVCPL